MVGPRATQPPTALPLYIKNNIIQILKRWNWKALQYMWQSNLDGVIPYNPSNGFHLMLRLSHSPSSGLQGLGPPLWPRLLLFPSITPHQAHWLPHTFNPSSTFAFPVTFSIGLLPQGLALFSSMVPNPTGILWICWFLCVLSACLLNVSSVMRGVVPTLITPMYFQHLGQCLHLVLSIYLLNG